MGRRGPGIKPCEPPKAAHQGVRKDCTLKQVTQVERVESQVETMAHLAQVQHAAEQHLAERVTLQWPAHLQSSCQAREALQVLEL